MSKKEFSLDWLSLSVYVVLVAFGWMNVYAVSSADTELFDMDSYHMKQLIWIGIAIAAAVVILVIEARDIEFSAYIIYAIVIILLILVLLFGKEVHNAKSWLNFGPISIQPSEFSKMAISLVLAKFMCRYNFNMGKLSSHLYLGLIMALPAVLILKQNEVGTVIIFIGFVLALYREGMDGIYILSLFLFGFVGGATLLAADAEDADAIYQVYTVVCTVGLMFIAGALYTRRSSAFKYLSLVVFVFIVYKTRQIHVKYTFYALAFLVSALSIYALIVRRKYKPTVFRNITLYVSVILVLILFAGGVNWVMTNVLRPHQRNRVITFIDPDHDPRGAGYNVNQSKIAIGSGSWNGKGYTEGTQTKYKYVPEQHTDFIFATVGEEWGWIGSAAVVILFLVFIWQLIYMAENSKSKFARIYGYCIACIFFMHVAINIAMTIGLAPVIGIPLPFFSYGGSSLLAFTAMFFVLQNFYANRTSIMTAEG